MSQAFLGGLISDYTDLRYQNQRFLLPAGRPGHRSEVDAQVTAAFSGLPVNARAARFPRKAAAAGSSHSRDRPRKTACRRITQRVI